MGLSDQLQFVGTLAVGFVAVTGAGAAITFYGLEQVPGDKGPPLVWLVLQTGVSIFIGAMGALHLLTSYFASEYTAATRTNRFKLDAYFPTKATEAQKATVAFLHRLNCGGVFRECPAASSPAAVHALSEAPSPYVSGLRVTGRMPMFEDKPTGAEPFTPPKEGALVVGTIRMGFGHHRIAYAASSWGLASAKATYFHDLLNITSAEATIIKEMDQLYAPRNSGAIRAQFGAILRRRLLLHRYSKGSRLATEMGGIVEASWGAATAKSGDENSLRVFYQMAEALKPLLSAVPKDTPIIATHCLVGLLAVACGFTKVVNLVIDNHAQWFIVVPGALNLVQGPTNYHRLLRMGVKPEQLKLAGAWAPRDLVVNIEADCAARIKRATAKKPVRLLVPVGGAGAQRTFVTNFVKAQKPLLDAGKVQLLLNAGDHEHMRDAFVGALEAIGYGTKYATVSNKKELDALVESLRGGAEPSMAVTLCYYHNDYFPAVATTDILSRVADVLACKPSELAFYPCPKLMIRRVGDHEAYSALRASELGDGTLEVREIADAMAYVNLFVDGPDLLTMMNEMVVKNKAAGLYDGCKMAVEEAMKM